MKLKLKEGKIDCHLTKIIGVLPVPSADPSFDPALTARQMRDAGAELVQLDGDAEGVLLEALGKVLAQGVKVGISTSDPVVMRKACDAGAFFISDPLALTAPGALQAAADLDCPVFLSAPVFASGQKWSEVYAADPVAAATEFFFERIDACLNAGIKRPRLVLNPGPAERLSVQQRVSIISRVQSFGNFGLPVALDLPEFGGKGSLADEEIASLALALFAANSHVALIRTREVAPLALGLATWQLVAQKAKPYKLSRGFIKRLRGLKHALRLHRKHDAESK